jgi:hypothetical protein
LNNSQILSLCVLVIALAVAFPNAYAAQSTSISGLTHPAQAVAGGIEPAEVSATVNYNDALPSWSLVVGILDAGTSPQRLVPGIAASSPDPCINQFVLTAFCIIKVSKESGLERLSFRIGGLLGGKRGPGTWELNITAALYDSNDKLSANTKSSVLFTIKLTPATLRLSVPAPVPVTVDGLQQPPGPAAVEVALGRHNVTVPLLVQIDTRTRLRFDHWQDGSTRPNMTFLVMGDTDLDVTYVTQNLLSVTGPQTNSTGAGWYDEGTTAAFSVAQTEPMSGFLGILGGKMSFQGWYLNGQLLTRSTTGSISMNQPHTIDAAWQMDYSEPVAFFGGIAIVLAFAYLLVRRRRAKRAKRRPRSRRK